MTIKFWTDKKYSVFSNFAPTPLCINGKTWPTAEHYYQAMKFTEDPEYMEEIRNAKTPYIAKRLSKSREHKLRSDWDQTRIIIMEIAVQAKYRQNRRFRELLQSTKGVTIEENAPYDNFWGTGKDETGRNMLGKILMKIRDQN